MKLRQVLWLCVLVLCAADAALARTNGAAAANEGLKITIEANSPQVSSAVDPALEPTGEPALVAQQSAPIATQGKTVPPSPLEDKPLGSTREGSPLGGRSDSEGKTVRPATGGTAGPWWMTAIALAVVIALVYGLKWMLTRLSGGRGGRSAGGAVEVLSRTPISARQSVMLLRVGSRVLVVGVGADGMNTLSEIDDPQQVSEVLGSVERAKAGSISGAFARALSARQVEIETESLDLADEDMPARQTAAGGAADQLRTLIDKVRNFGEANRRRP